MRRVRRLRQFALVRRERFSWRRPDIVIWIRPTVSFEDTLATRLTF